jgi:hypothetical protein
LGLSWVQNTYKSDKNQNGSEAFNNKITQIKRIAWKYVMLKSTFLKMLEIRVRKALLLSKIIEFQKHDGA